jgi:hypothetical protein
MIVPINWFGNPAVLIKATELTEEQKRVKASIERRGGSYHYRYPGHCMVCGKVEGDHIDKRYIKKYPNACIFEPVPQEPDVPYYVIDASLV